MAKSSEDRPFKNGWRNRDDPRKGWDPEGSVVSGLFCLEMTPIASHSDWNGLTYVTEKPGVVLADGSADF